MKKLIVGIFLASILASTAVQAAPAQGRGGFAGFFVGCCLGIRTGGEWNTGKDLHLREYLRIIPVVSLIVGIWDGIDVAQGTTSVDLQARYPGNFF